MDSKFTDVQGPLFCIPQNAKPSCRICHLRRIHNFQSNC